MSITKIATRRPVTIFMFFTGVVLLGFVSLRELSVDLLPDISYPKLSVVVRYPGVAPEEIETMITDDLEAAVSRIPGLRRVESISKEGVCHMTLEFAWGTDMDFAMLHTREELDSVRDNLPGDAEEPAIIPLDPQSKPILTLSVSGNSSLLELKEFSEELIKPRLEQIEGIGSAEIAGGLEREIHVEVNPKNLALYDLSIEDIARRIDAFNRNLQGGTIQKGRFKYSLRVVGEFESLKEIGDISLKTTPQRGVIKLNDVAAIKDSVKEREGIIRLNGRESIGILVRKESGSNTVRVTQLARDVLEEIRHENPALDIFIVAEQAKYIENAVASVLNAIIAGGILALLVLFVFLQDIKTLLIIAAVIPISIIATFNLLYFRGITLNIMSLGGLALGLGMFVDNSIVVSEGIFRHRGSGINLSRAAAEGTREVGMAVTASTLTTVSVFLPVIYVHGVAGQLFKDQALTVTFALLSSLVVSMTLLPALSSRRFAFRYRDSGNAEPAENEETERYPGKSRFRFLLFPLLGLRGILYTVPRAALLVFRSVLLFLFQAVLLGIHYIVFPLKPVCRTASRGFNFLYRGFEKRYHRLLLRSLENKSRVVLGSGVFLVVTIGIATLIPRELMPKPESAAFEIHMKAPVDYSLEQTGGIVGLLEAWLRERSEVRSVFSQIGIVSGMEALNPDVSFNSARLYITAGRPSQVDGLIDSLRIRLKDFPGLSYSIVREQSALTEFLAFASAEVGLKIKGEDLNRLTDLAERIAEKISEVQGVTNVTTNLGEGKPEFLMRIKKEALEKHDISSRAVGSFLVDAVRGQIATQFKELEKKYDVRVHMEEKTRENIESILNEQISHEGTAIPLRELVTYTIARGPREIRRENQQREVVVIANLKGRAISQAVPDINKKIAAIGIPQGYSVHFSGEQEEMTKSFRSLILAFSLAVLLVYMIMAAQFESLKHPFIILFTLPMGLTGAVWAIFITGQTLNVVSIIGMVVLAGIVVNDAIVKIDCTNQMRKKGFPVRQAIVEASRIRLRPILMTTVTTALGLFPMSLGLGRGSELQKPLAIAVIGGLLLATFLTLILIPLAYEAAESRKAAYES